MHMLLDHTFLGHGGGKLPGDEAKTMPCTFMTYLVCIRCDMPSPHVLFSCFLVLISVTARPKSKKIHFQVYAYE